MGSEGADYFPTLSSVQQPLPHEQLEILEKHYAQEQPNASVQTRFNLAWGYVKSNATTEQKKGLDLLVGIYRDSPSRRRECLFYLALGSYKLGDYTAARKYADVLLEYEPQNRQIFQLRQEIENKLNREGMIGMAIVGGAAALVATGATVLGVVLGRKRH